MLFSGESGVVHSLDETHVVIKFSDKDACDHCGLKVVCAPGKESDRRLTLVNPGDVQLGQMVQVEEMSNLELHLASSQFGLPMLLFLTGLLLGYYLPLSSSLPKELVAFLFALVGLVTSFPLAKALIQNITDKIPEKYLRIVPQN